MAKTTKMQQQQGASSCAVVVVCFRSDFDEFMGTLILPPALPFASLGILVSMCSHYCVRAYSHNSFSPMRAHSHARARSVAFSRKLRMFLWYSQRSSRREQLCYCIADAKGSSLWTGFHL